MPSSATIAAPGNYLTKLAFEQESRKWQRRECAVLLNIVFPRKGLRKLATGQLRVLNISEGGLMATSRLTEFPDHFYVVIGEAQYYIGCSLVHRESDILHIRFIAEQPTVFINVVASLTDPFALLEKIRPALYGLEGLA
ncbi:hypothetical protein DFR52_102797 [Hoeflea marina]|uniref:PilZ domain-containing protein n=1 Tax=Hoeflea marina TaxID=274592 RepID=A0A317PPQ0_9HYPH|nr:hypothetical protein [Hoeflea marina]PWW02129.1 hypothetical protein DFR52_102797 [Hoeflea marina]